MRCVSYCKTDSYRFKGLADYLRRKKYDVQAYEDVLYIRKDSWEIEKSVCIFTYGCLVAWGLSEDEEKSILKELEPYQTNPLELFKDDTIKYLTGKKTKIDETTDELIVEEDDPFIKLSISYALSQSIKLIVFESSVDKTIEKTQQFPKELAQQGKISMSKRTLSKKIGELFATRNLINLHSKLLDTPEFFWKRSRYEPYYLMAAEFLDIQMRTDILNRRLEIMHELYGALSDELNHKHSARLEWVIILLIVVEVLISIFDHL